MRLRDMKYIGFKHQRENKQNSDDDNNNNNNNNDNNINDKEINI
jgi:hypothetical protein